MVGSRRTWELMSNAALASVINPDSFWGGEAAEDNLDEFMNCCCWIYFSVDFWYLKD